MSHSNCLTQNVSQNVSFLKCLIWSLLIKMSLPKYFNQNVSLNDPKCLTQWFKMSHSMTQNVSIGSSLLLFVKTILTFPQLLVPKETIPTRYLVWSKLPRFCDIKGPPESPEQESFPIKRTIKCCCSIKWRLTLFSTSAEVFVWMNFRKKRKTSSALLTPQNWQFQFLQKSTR